MSIRRTAVMAAGMLTAFALSSAAAQQTATHADSANTEIRTVLRAFYFNLVHKDWEALGAYVLSPKILERRTGSVGLQAAAKDWPRARAPSRPIAGAGSCPSSDSAMISRAAIRIDGDWAEVSVPRCGVAFAGTDEFRLLYLEARWRFIYTDLFEEPANVSADR